MTSKLLIIFSFLKNLYQTDQNYIDVNVYNRIFKLFFQKAPLKKLKKLWAPLTKLLKKLPLKPPKIIFCSSSLT